MKHAISFLAEFFRNRRLTGSIIPSSRFLAQALAEPMSRCRARKQVLEIGPGTGPVTVKIAEFLRPGDRFVMVEANPAFCEILRTLCRTTLAPRMEGVEVEIHCSLLEEVETRAGFDFAVSGLPLNNFPVAVVRRILQAIERLLGPDGTLSYFEYLGMRPLLGRLRMLTRGNPWPIRSSKVLDRFLDRHQVVEQRVLLNLPPAIVRHIRAPHAEEVPPRG
ncbi:MAG: methyltransferase domain-containing protein [Candidatus Riflebacteria bacterium]|nr:methyltransferase domain-containing protein [Candidatus Riflebacteria bacterium]